MMPYIYITVSSYGLMAGLGFAVSISWLFYRNISEPLYNLEFKEFLRLILLSGAGCLIGSKLVYGLTQIPFLFSDFSLSGLVNSFIFGGFVFYGGLGGGFLGAWIFAKWRKYDLISVLGFVTPAFALFHVFGRIGCLFAGCCYGFHLENDLIIGNVQFHYFPIQAVETLFEFIMFFILKRIKMPDVTFKTYLIAYACFRFVAEFFRGDSIRGMWLFFSTSQWISLIILLTLTVACIIKKYNNKKTVNL